MQANNLSQAARFVLAILVLAGATKFSSAAEFFDPVMDTVGQSWADYNNDGYSDIFGKSSYWTNDYANNPDSWFGVPGTPFIEHANALGGLTHTWNTAMGDFNNDGLVDATGYLGGQLNGNTGGTPVIYRNDGGDVWTDVTSTVVQPTSIAPESVNRGHHLADFDGDGFLDMYATSWVTVWVSYVGPPDRDTLWMNGGGTSLTHTWSAPAPRNAKGSTHCDFDRDGDQDVYVSNYWYDANFLLVNEGFNGSTGLNNQPRGAGTSGHTQGSTFGDFNNDGEFDIFVSNFDHGPNPDSRFLLNSGGPNYTFTNVGLKGIIQVEPFDSGVPADFDNDGDLDIFTTTNNGYGAIPARLYANNGDFDNFQFTHVGIEYGLAGEWSGGQYHGGVSLTSGTSHAAWGDYNNDGFLDLIADGTLWRNPGAENWPDNHYLKLKLQGGEGRWGTVNESAIGTQVRVNVPGLGTITRQVSGSTGQGMQNDLTVHLGLGTNTDPVDVEIFWPDGNTQILSNVAVDQYLIVDIDGPIDSVAPPPLPPPSCDLNVNSVCDAEDLDKLYEDAGYDLVNGVSSRGFERLDLNSDGVVNNLDIDVWLDLAATDSGYDSSYLRGDTIGLGSTFPDVRDINLFDYNVLAGFFDPLGLRGPYPWSMGNFDGDGDIDLSDYNSLTANFNLAAGYDAASTAVPEPAAILLFGFGCLTVLSCMRRER